METKIPFTIEVGHVQTDAAILISNRGPPFINTFYLSHRRVSVPLLQGSGWAATRTAARRAQ